MRRKDREITNKQEIKDIIDACQVCRIAVISEGVPYVTPMNFGCTEENGIFTFYFHGIKLGKKVDALRSGDRVCVELDLIDGVVSNEDNSDFTTKYRSVIGFGNPVFIEDIEEKKKALQILCDHYEEFNGIPMPEKRIPVTAVYKIVVDEITGKANR